MTLSISSLNRSFAFIVALAFLLPSLNSRTASAAVPDVALIIEKSGPHIAVFIPQNLSGRSAPLRKLRESLIRGITASGIPVLDDASLSRFMERHRIRYTGGIDSESAVALQSEEKVDAVLLTAVELYDESYPPKIGILSRLVSTGDGMEILWADSVAISGDDSPGILGIGVISDPDALREKAVESLVQSLSRHLSGEKTEEKPVDSRYAPRFFYQSVALSGDSKSTVGVVPFLNESDRKYAGEIITLHFLTELVRDGRFHVVEPGVIRQRLLHMRIIMPWGMTLTDADYITLSLDSDMVFSGAVISYEDFSGSTAVPKVDFSVTAIDKLNKRMILSSKSYNKGDDGVFFFNGWKVNTAGRLASYMVRSLVGKIPLYGEDREPVFEDLPYSP
jgi:hypothetical protein